MLFEDVNHDDDLVGLETSQLEVLRRNLFQASFENPIQQNNTAKHTQSFSEERNRKRPRIQVASDAE